MSYPIVRMLDNAIQLKNIIHFKIRRNGGKKKEWRQVQLQNGKDLRKQLVSFSEETLEKDMK